MHSILQKALPLPGSWQFRPLRRSTLSDFADAKACHPTLQSLPGKRAD
jgi:hypothetical protein